MDCRSLFIDKDKVVLTSVDLACIVGDLEEAVVLNQISYWIEKYKDANHNFKDGKYWVYNSYQKWHDDNFPFWHTSKIQRIFKSLEKKGLLVSANYNNVGFDKTKWYSIDYERLQKMIDNHTYENEQSLIEDKNSLIENELSSIENEQSLIESDCPIPVEYIQENTTEDNYRDYSTENTEKEHTVSKDTAKVHTVVSGRNKLHTDKPIEKYLSLKDKEEDMLKRALKICLKHYDEEISKEIVLTIAHFLDRYTERTGKIHPILTDDTLERIIDTIADFGDDEYCHYSGKLIEEPGVFRDMVDEYFNTDFGKINGGETNYRLPHFVSYEILSRLSQRLI